MACTINASATNGIVQTADGSGLLKVQSGGVTTNALAWVNFNGSGTITSAYNVSSVTRTGTGQYTVNMTNAMANVNYAAVANINSQGYGLGCIDQSTRTTTTMNVLSLSNGGVYIDAGGVDIAVFATS